MSRVKIVIGLIVLAFIAAGLFIWLQAASVQQSVDDYQAHNATTESQLLQGQQSLDLYGDAGDMSVDQLTGQLDIIRQQLDYLSQQKDSLPTIRDGLLTTEVDVDRAATLRSYDDLTALYQELYERVAAERDSSVVNEAYNKSAMEASDYQKTISDLAEIARAQAAKPYANAADKQLSKWYGIILSELENADRAFDRGDRAAYDQANSKIDSADKSIRSAGQTANNYRYDLLDRINSLIKKLS